MSISIIIGADVPPGATSIDRAALSAFIRANLVPVVDVTDVVTSQVAVGGFVAGGVMAELSLSREPNDAALAALVALYLSGDLVTIADAAAACNVGIKRISAAVSVGALRGYTNPAAPNPRKGGTLVSLAACKQKWGDDGEPMKLEYNIAEGVASIKPDNITKWSGGGGGDTTQD